MRLCGISSRFQLLSPCTGQVAHALLTRPPLSHKIFISEENQIKCFVRLACVKHAASVHPEPGSNSRIKNLGFVLWSLMFVYASHVLSEVSHELRTVEASSFVSSSEPTFWLILPFLLLFGIEHLMRFFTNLVWKPFGFAELPRVQYVLEFFLL